MNGKPNNLSFIVVGASGDLASRKIYPALFALYSQGFLPDDFSIFGFARTPMSHDEFRAHLKPDLPCRYSTGSACQKKTESFLARCFYSQGNYASRDSFLDLYTIMKEHEPGNGTKRIFYLAIPPSVFLDTARALAGAGLITCDSPDAWPRVVIEKPFGKDRETSDLLTAELAKVFSESQTFRIDHYLGKEVVQNLLVLRFANLIFEPIWNRTFIESIHIDWKETLGVGNRGGYFDEYGIIRDVVQNHLTQILSLTAMEQPESTSASHIRTEKLKVLRAIQPVTTDDVILGQYTGSPQNGRLQPAYAGEKGIPPDSKTPTFATAVLKISNPRWQGVPFYISAGKGLNENFSQVRIRFRRVPDNIFCNSRGCPQSNDLIIRIQPDEGIFLNVINKEPGLGLALVQSTLNLRYQSAFHAKIPDAYERLILDVIDGDHSLFISSAELAASWDLFTPFLHECEQLGIRPEPYPFGSDGPVSARKFAEARLA